MNPQEPAIDDQLTDSLAIPTLGTELAISTVLRTVLTSLLVVGVTLRLPEYPTPYSTVLLTNKVVPVACATLIVKPEATAAPHCIRNLVMLRVDCPTTDLADE